MDLQIADSSRNEIVGFAGKAAPLFTRSMDDLLELAIQARQSNNKNIQRHFVNLPTLSELLKAKTDKQLGDLLPAPADSALPIVGNGDPDNKPSGSATDAAEDNAEIKEASAGIATPSIALPEPKGKNKATA